MLKVSVQSELELSCEADAYPPVNQYTWSKNNVDLQLNQSKLIFVSVDVSFEFYLLKGENLRTHPHKVGFNLFSMVNPYKAGR